MSQKGSFQRKTFNLCLIFVLLSSSTLAVMSTFVQPAKAAVLPNLRLKWQTGSLGNGAWEGGFVIGDFMPNIQGEEVLFAGEDYVRAFNGITGARLWTYYDTAIYAYAQPHLYDLDGDGDLEAVIPLFYPVGVLALNGDGTRYWRTSTGMGGGTIMGTLAAADVDGDSRLEIFVGAQNVEDSNNNGVFEGRISKLSYNGQILAQTFAWRACSGGVSIADADNDGEFEIYVGDRDMYYGDGDYGKGVRSFWASNLTQRWCNPDILTSSQCPVLADVNDDGILDVIVSDMEGGIAILNSTSGSAKPLPFVKTMGSLNGVNVPGHYQETVYDVDGDGHLELITADGTHSTSNPDYANRVFIVDLVDLTIDAILNTGQCKFSPTLADLTGDGEMDIIVCSMTNIQIWSYQAGSYVLIETETGPPFAYGLLYAIAQDIDNDGFVELVVSRASASSARLYALDTDAPAPAQRVRSEVKWYSEYRRGAAEYIAPPAKTLSISQSLILGSQETSESSAMTLLSDFVQQTFGKTDVGAYYRDLCDYYYGSRYQIQSDGTAESISLYVRDEVDGESRAVEVAVYADSGGVPAALLSQGVGTISDGYTGWVTVNLDTQPNLVANNFYWLVANARATGERVDFYYSAGSTNQAVYGTTSLASFPTEPIVATGYFSRAYSIYCTYTGSFPDKFGKTDIGTSSKNLAAYYYGSKYNLITTAQANSITLYVREMNGEARPIEVALYADNAGVPSSLLAQGADTIPANFFGWFTVSLATQPILEPGNYWLVANARASGKTVNFYYAGGSTNQAVYGTTSLASFPTEPIVATGYFSRAYSIYCSITPPAPPEESDWVLKILENGDIECTNAEDVDPNNRGFNWYANDYRYPTTSTPVSMTNLLLAMDNDAAVTDYSGYGNNGENYGADWVSNGKKGGAYYFDGVSDCITIPDGGLGYFNGYSETRPGNLASDGTWSEMTLELWVYLDGPQSNVRFATKLPSFEIGLSSNGRLFAGVMRQAGTDLTEKGFLGYTSRTASSSYPLNPGQWYHVAFTYKSGQGLRLYMNGQLISQSSAVTGNIHCSSGEPLMLGWFDYFKGMIDEVKLYRKALSSEQIAQNYLQDNEGWTDRSIIKVQETRGQEKWKCEVSTDDGTGNVLREWAYTEEELPTNYIEIPNNPPVASLIIGPRQILDPLDTEDLSVSYVYSDLDGNTELGTEVRWYRNSVLREDLNGQLVVSSSATSVGDIWYCTVAPKDGKDFGTTVVSRTLNIVVNNPPTIIGTPTLVSSSGNLICDAATSDPDGPAPTRNIYNWRVGGTSISNLQLPFDTDYMFGNAKDYSSNANNGVISGATWTDAGIVGGAYHFDGNDLITCADNNLGGTAAGTWTQLTIEFWIKTDDWLNGTRMVAKKVGGSSSGSYMVGFQTTANTSISPGNQLFFTVTTTSGNGDTWDDINNDTIHAQNVLQPGVWYHIICTYQSGPGLTVYINGVQTANLPWTGTITTETDVGGDEPLFIGSDGSGGANRYLNGTLDELTIYNRALSAEQAYQRWFESKDGLSINSTVVVQETSPSQVWTCMVTTNDKYGDGESALSNSVIT